MDDNLLPLDAGRRGAFPAAARRRASTRAASDRSRCRCNCARTWSRRRWPTRWSPWAWCGRTSASTVIRASSWFVSAATRPPTRAPAPSPLLSARGVFAVCNALLVGPTIPLESIRAELEAMRAIRGAPLHLLPIDVRAGTTYHARAESRGLLEGGFLWRRYRFEDPRTAVLAEVITGPAVATRRALGAARPLRSRLQPRNRAPAHSRAPARARGRDLRARQRRLERRPAPDPRRRGATSRPTAIWRRRAASSVDEEPRVRRFDRALIDETEDALRAVEAGGPRQRAPPGAGCTPAGSCCRRSRSRWRWRAAAGRSLSADGGRDAPGAIEVGGIEVGGYDWHWSAPEVAVQDGACSARPTDDAGFQFEVDTASASAGGRK